METFYDFLTKNQDITSFESIKVLADELKTEKAIVVDGLHNEENYNGRAFAWSSQEISIWFSKQATRQETTLYIIVRGDILSEEILELRLNGIFAKTSQNRSVQIINRKLAKGDILLELKLKSSESEINLEFKDIENEGEGRRKLSVPITAFILTYSKQSTHQQFLEFWNQSHLFDFNRGIARFIGKDNDAVSDYFVKIMDETSN